MKLWNMHNKWKGTISLCHRIVFIVIYYSFFFELQNVVSLFSPIGCGSRCLEIGNFRNKKRHVLYRPFWTGCLISPTWKIQTKKIRHSFADETPPKKGRKNGGFPDNSSTFSLFKVDISYWKLILTKGDFKFSSAKRLFRFCKTMKRE